MSGPKRILVGVDGSDGSMRALRWALAEAGRRGDSVEVVHCWHVPYYGDMSGMAPYPVEVMDESAKALLASVLSSVADDARGVELSGRTVSGNAATALIDASAGADLLVVGRRGHGGFLTLVMGSVAQQVASHAHCPVVIVGGD
jgi:nucleotide-binding universal stress UspA family protein